MENGKQPLLSPGEVDQSIHEDDGGHLLEQPHRPSAGAFFTPGREDIGPITSVRDFFREFSVETKKLWYLAGPAIFTSLCQYSLGAITQLLAGHVSTIALAAVSVENSVIAGFSFGIMLGMGSALETLCGQAFGAGQLDMLGIYMQRSWVILNSTALVLSLLYVFAQQILKLIGQTAQISEAAGVFAIWMIPQLFAYAINFPIAKFLQAQSKIMVMAAISGVVLVLHAVFSWLFMLKLGWGLVGAAVVLNASWVIIVVAQLVYIFSGTCGRAWSGFSWKAFQNLWGFVRLSLASAVMLCMNILGWTVMVTLGMNAAISVRVSNELGAGNPRTAIFSLGVAVITSFVIGVIVSIILIAARNDYPSLFSSDTSVEDLVKKLTALLAFCIVMDSIQPVLSGTHMFSMFLNLWSYTDQPVNSKLFLGSTCVLNAWECNCAGVAVGAGWQAAVAYVNIACYYLFGVPLGLIMGYKLGWGVEGIWAGMVCGTILQTIVLFFMVYRTNWSKEASIAEDRIRTWGGREGSETIDQKNDVEK
ncbi:hypothetical protein CDL15_Pgr024419 [Punica granatum]|uniref:Protein DETOXIFICATION n=1 Tax=Punica granatum TaxID=22663 RepID=A0A218XYS8_PUNGR|nr:hypothetical protein CDL15_Pgr024419 [Punica granatum]